MLGLVKTRPNGSTPWPKGLRLEERPSPTLLEPDEVKIEVLAAGICGTDVGIYNNKDSIRAEMRRAFVDQVIVGHEFAGRVVDAGPKALEFLQAFLEFRGFSPDKILSQLANEYFASAEMHIPCNRCRTCRMGQRHACPNTIIKGIHQNGAFTNFLTVPVANLQLFSKKEIPIEIIAFMDALGNAVHTAQEEPLMGKSVAVLGCGVQGLMATAVASQSGASTIFVTDVSNPEKGLTPEKVEKKRFAMARKFGANFTFDLGLKDGRKEMLDTVLGETGGDGVDLVFEMSGSYKAYADAFDLVRAGGTVLLLGIPEGETNLNFSDRVIFRGVMVKGVIGRRMFESWETMKDLLKSGLSDLFLKSGFVSHQLPLSRFEEGFAAMRSGEAFKVLLLPEK